MIDAFLRAGVDPNSANPGGETALMTATRTGKLDAVKLLIDRGAARERKGRRTRTDGADVGRSGESSRRA